MASGSYEIRDFNVGGVPRYAQREVAHEPDPSAEFAAYGDDPDGLAGVSPQSRGDELQETDAERGTGEDLADGSPDSLKFGDLEEVPDEGDYGAGDRTKTGDEDLLDEGEVVIPAQPTAADSPVEEATSDAVDHDPADDATDEDAASPEAAETPDSRFEDKTATPDEAAAIIAAEFGLDIEEARRLVAEAQADLDAEAEDRRDEPAKADSKATPEASAEDEHEGEAETAENTSSRDRVVTFLRKVASKTGQVTSNEAAIFAEGARALGEDFREWYATRDERGRERSLDQVRKKVEKGVRKWEKFEKHRGRMGTQAPRGTEDR